MADALVIDTTDLSKRFDDVDAVRGLNLQVPAGSICGFLGRNGAGKTTTLKMLLGMVRPTGGRARVLGRDVTRPADSVDIRRRTAFVSDDKDLYGYMTVEQMVRFTSAFYQDWQPDVAARHLRTFQLPVSRRVKALSRGMQSKLAMTLALSRRAELLVLDEPTSGLDPAASEEVLQALVSQMANESTSIFFSSHQISEVEQIADYVVIIDHGRAVVAGGLDDLRHRYRRIQIVFDADAPELRLHAPGICRTWRDGRVLTVLSSEGSDAVTSEARALAPRSIDVMPVSLKDIFLASVAGEE